jgi:hypothetical protein
MSSQPTAPRASSLKFRLMQRNGGGEAPLTHGLCLSWSATGPTPPRPTTTLLPAGTDDQGGRQYGLLGGDAGTYPVSTGVPVGVRVLTGADTAVAAVLTDAKRERLGAGYTTANLTREGLFRL